MSSDEEKIKTLIPAEFHMISGSHDVQTSADVFNVNKVRIVLCVCVDVGLVWCDSLMDWLITKWTRSES